MKTAQSIAIALAPLLILVGAPAAAQEDSSFTGGFRIGYRSVDVGGTLNKYKEDLNLDDGPRLFSFDLKYIPAEGEASFADRVQIGMNNLGGDPFETLSVSVERYGRFDFRYDRAKSTYFYEDIILPVELAGDPALARAGDFHHFDFDRVRDSADLKIWINQDAQFNFGFHRFTKKGHATTTLDVSRDEFELDRTVDESLDDYFASFQYAWDKVTLVLEERFRDYDNVVEIFLPGRSLGEDPEDATILDFFFLDQPYDFSSQDHIARLVARPSSKLLLRVQADLQELDLDLKGDESSAGTAFTGLPFTTDVTGRADLERDLELLDLDLTYKVNNRWALLASAREYTLDQAGRVEFDGNGIGDWEIDTSSYELGVQVALSPEVTAAAGLRREDRQIDHRWDLEGEAKSGSEKTDQSGYFGSLAWSPVKSCRLTLDVEDSSYDHPFTLSAPTDRTRYKLRGRYTAENGFSVTGSYSMNEVDNKDSGWSSGYDQLDVRLGYRKEALQGSLGYSSIEITRRIDQTVTTLPGFGGGVVFGFPINYEADSSFVDGRLRYTPDGRWACGGSFRLYENNGTFPLEREDLRGWFEVDLSDSYLLHLGYRVVDYDEQAFNFDDYDADILDVSIGYRW